MQFVVFANGIVLCFSALLMAMVALLFPATADAFGAAALLSGALGLMLAAATSSSFAGFRRLHTFILTSSVWLTAALAGGLPLYLWQMSPVDALFEAMSGITTTGSTVMSGLDSTPRGILLWRAILQALGGVGFVVTGIALLPALRVGGMQLFRTESSDKGEKELNTAAGFALATLIVYLSVMGLCFIAYFAGGMSFFDAVTHAMTTVSTGGYSTYDASFGHFQSGFLQWSATVFMVLGALPFAWYIRAVNRGVFRSEQVQAMLWRLGAVIAMLVLWRVAVSDTGLLTALREVSFNVVSVVTTTGYATTDYTTWGPVATVAFFLLTAVGGCTGSTAGGAKAMRWVLLGRSVWMQMGKVYQPNAVSVLRYEGRKVEDDVLAGVIAFFSIYFMTFALLAAALGMTGLDFLTAVSGALTALANVGPGIGPVIGPAGNFASLGDEAKILLVFGMFAGRLEILTVFVLFTAAFWREV